jgi:predicted ATP-dependent endonuclease of OLD family
MRVESVEIWNIKGIDHLLIKTGSITVLKGSNETGKSSVLDAIRCVFSGGHSPELIRRGAEKGEVLLTLDNGTTIRRTITAKESKARILTADGARIPKEETFLKGLASSFAFDPMAFLEGKSKEQRDRRLKFVLEALPIEFTRDEVTRAAGSQAKQATYTLDELQAFRDGRYQRRREINKELDDLHATRRTIAQVLPDGDILKFANSESKGAMPPSTVKAEHSESVRALSEAKERLGQALTEWRQTLIGEQQAINLAEFEEIEAIRREMEQRMEAVRAAKNNERELLATRYEELVAQERKPFDAEIETAAGREAQLRQQMENEAKLQGVRESIASIDKQIKGKESEAVDLDDAVKALDELRRQKLDSLPIEGVEVRGGEIFYNSLPFDQLNTQNKIFLACQIGALKFGGLPLMICDQIEQVDDLRWQEFCDAVRGSGFQVIAARVDVETDEQGNPIEMPLTVSAA